MADCTLFPDRKMDEDKWFRRSIYLNSPAFKYLQKTHPEKTQEHENLFSHRLTA